MESKVPRCRNVHGCGFRWVGLRKIGLQKIGLQKIRLRKVRLQKVRLQPIVRQRPRFPWTRLQWNENATGTWFS